MDQNNFYEIPILSNVDFRALRRTSRPRRPPPRPSVSAGGGGGGGGGGSGSGSGSGGGSIPRGTILTIACTIFIASSNRCGQNLDCLDYRKSTTSSYCINCLGATNSVCGNNAVLCSDFIVISPTTCLNCLVPVASACGNDAFVCKDYMQTSPKTCIKCSALTPVGSTTCAASCTDFAYDLTSNTCINCTLLVNTQCGGNTLECPNFRLQGTSNRCVNCLRQPTLSSFNCGGDILACKDYGLSNASNRICLNCLLPSPAGSTTCGCSNFRYNAATLQCVNCNHAVSNICGTVSGLCPDFVQIAPASNTCINCLSTLGSANASAPNCGADDTLKICQNYMVISVTTCMNCSIPIGTSCNPVCNDFKYDASTNSCKNCAIPTNGICGTTAGLCSDYALDSSTQQTCQNCLVATNWVCGNDQVGCINYGSTLITQCVKCSIPTGTSCNTGCTEFRYDASTQSCINCEIAPALICGNNAALCVDFVYSLQDTRTCVYCADAVNSECGEDKDTCVNYGSISSSACVKCSTLTNSVCGKDPVACAKFKVSPTNPLACFNCNKTQGWTNPECQICTPNSIAFGLSCLEQKFAAETVQKKLDAYILIPAIISVLISLF